MADSRQGLFVQYNAMIHVSLRCMCMPGRGGVGGRGGGGGVQSN